MTLEHNARTTKINDNKILFFTTISPFARLVKAGRKPRLFPTLYLLPMLCGTVTVKVAVVTLPARSVALYVTETLLQAYPGIQHVIRFDQDARLPLNGPARQIDIEFEGDTAATADLLEYLVQEGIRLISFSEVTTDLEEAFLRLTEGEVA